MFNSRLVDPNNSLYYIDMWDGLIKKKPKCFMDYVNDYEGINSNIAPFKEEKDEF